MSDERDYRDKDSQAQSAYLAETSPEAQALSSGRWSSRQAGSAAAAAQRLQRAVTEDRVQRASLQAQLPPVVADTPAETLPVAGMELRWFQRLVESRLSRSVPQQSRSRQDLMQAMRETWGSEFASGELRVVFGDEVRLWMRPDRRSKTTRLLRRGTVVRALERRRNWTLVEYDAGAVTGLAEGWVFNKYLRSVTPANR